MISNVRSLERSPEEPASGGAPAFDLAAHRPVMFRFAVTLSSLDDAEDLVQDALARAWVKRASFDPDRGSLRSWLLAIVADQARNRWRRRRPLEDVVDARSLSTPAVGELGADLRRAIGGLPPRQRTAIVLHHFVDLPVAEVAELMTCSVGTVKSTLHDARKALASTLGESYARDR
jgi:RNA polymerase sigma factor (sigma-70 family)